MSTVVSLTYRAYYKGVLGAYAKKVIVSGIQAIGIITTETIWVVVWPNTDSIAIEVRDYHLSYIFYLSIYIGDIDADGCDTVTVDTFCLHFVNLHFVVVRNSIDRSNTVYVVWRLKVTNCYNSKDMKN